MRVEIRPLEVEKWHGKQGVESFTQSKVVEALVDSESGILKIGLNAEEIEKYSKALNVDLNPALVANGKPHPFYGDRAGWLILPNRTISLTQIILKNMFYGN